MGYIVKNVCYKVAYLVSLYAVVIGLLLRYYQKFENNEFKETGKVKSNARPIFVPESLEYFNAQTRDHLNATISQLVQMASSENWQIGKSSGNITIEIADIAPSFVVRSIARFPFNASVVAQTASWTFFRKVQREVDSMYEDTKLLSKLTIDDSKALRYINEAYMIRKTTQKILYFKKRSFDLILANGKNFDALRLPRRLLGEFEFLVSKCNTLPTSEFLVNKGTLFSSLIAIDLSSTAWKTPVGYSQGQHDMIAWFIPSFNVDECILVLVSRLNLGLDLPRWPMRKVLASKAFSSMVALKSYISKHLAR